MGLCKDLGNLATVLGGNNVPPHQNFPVEEPSDLLENIMGDLKSLRLILDEFKVTSTGGVLRQRWNQFLWAFRESDVDDLRKSIEAYKAILILTMTVYVL